jgi:hypothetical protein
MAAVHAPLLGFNRGEVSKIALARVDLAKLQLSAQCQVNWLPWVIGPMMLRPGLYHVGEILNDSPAKLVRFVFSKLDTALIELTAGQMRVWVDEVIVTRVAVGTTIVDPTFTGTAGGWSTSGTTAGAIAALTGGLALTCDPVSGLAQVTQTVPVAAADRGKEHALRIRLTGGNVVFRVGSTPGGSDLIAQTTLGVGYHSLAFTPTTATFTIEIETTEAVAEVISCDIEAAGPMILPTPWAAGDLANVRYDQSGDIIFIACRGQQQQKIERRGVHSWSVVTYFADDGPFNEEPGIEANFTVDKCYGQCHLTSDRPWFQPSHVGCLFRLFTPGQFNNAVLGGNNAFTPAVRVTGVGAARNYSWGVAGTWSGTLTFQRSFDSATSGFVDVSSIVANGSTSSSTGGSGGTPDLDNVIAWERVGFKGGDYTSGAANVASNYSGGGGFGICRVSKYVSPTKVNIEVIDAFPSTNPTKDWVEQQWSGVSGFPSSVAFHEGRLGWFGANQAWLSASDNFTGYADINLDGTSPGDAGAINVTLGSGPVDVISWGLSLTRLLLGREQSIASARSSNFDQPLTPTLIVIRDCSDQGAQRLPAIKAGKRGIFVQQSGRRVYELYFNPQEFDYAERDLTRLNWDIGSAGFTDIDKATQPDKTIFLPRGDGQCAALLYDVDDQVEAWWRIMTLGVIENIAVLPQDGFEDLTYFVVKRTINGATRRFIERLAPRTNCVGGSINQQLDSHVVYQGSPVTSITLAHLPNTLVSVWADGAAIGSGTTDSSGKVTFPDKQAHSNVVAGLAGAVVSNAVTTPVGSGELDLEDGSGELELEDGSGDLDLGAQAYGITVGAQYNGYPAEVFADIGCTGEPKHIGALTVTNGAITLPNGQNATVIVAMLGYVAPFQSAKLAYAAQKGSPLNQKKRIDHVGLVLYDTYFQGLQLGQRPDVLDNLPLMEAGQQTGVGTTWSEYDEPMIEVPGSWNTDSRLFLLAQAPSPVMVGGVVVGMATNEK